jgi:hypothetical protein
MRVPAQPPCVALSYRQELLVSYMPLLSSLCRRFGQSLMPKLTSQRFQTIKALPGVVQKLLAHSAIPFTGSSYAHIRRYKGATRFATRLAHKPAEYNTHGVMICLVKPVYPW